MVSTIMFMYQTLPENDSLVLLIHYHYGAYEVRFQAMSICDSIQFSFIQSKIPTDAERDTLFEWVDPLFQEQHVINRLQDPFRYCIVHTMLQYSKSS